jgi:hypothetical protein
LEYLRASTISHMAAEHPGALATGKALEEEEKRRRDVHFP